MGGPACGAANPADIVDYRQMIARRANHPKIWVNPRLQKYFAGPVGQISRLTPAILSHQRGVGHRRKRGAGSGGRGSTRDERAAAYGEIVWVRRPGAGVKSAEAKADADDGGKKAGHQDDYV